MKLTDEEVALLWEDEPKAGDAIGRFKFETSVDDWSTTRWMTYTLAVLKDAEDKLWGCTRGFGLTEYQEHEEPDSDLFPVKAVPSVEYVQIKKHKTAKAPKPPTEHNDSCICSGCLHDPS